MKYHNKWVGFLLILIFLSQFLFSQEISEKKEIAIFSLSYYKFKDQVPPGALGSIDDQLKSVFINLGRFTINAMTYQLEDTDVNTFINTIMEYKADTVEIPEEVQMGHEFFSAADLERLIGSFIVVIPSVSYFNVDRNRRETETGETVITYDSEIKTSFTFINVEEGTAFAQFFVETTGYSDDDPKEAIQDAINGIANKMEFELRSIDVFTLKTGVIEVDGGTVYIQFGKDMGVQVGYEFAIEESRVLDAGLAIQKETGLIIIKEVTEKVSIGSIFYGSPEIGDQLKEVPRMGVDGIPYAHIGMDFEGNFYSFFGLRAAYTKGFYSFRPIVGLEIPVVFSDNLLTAMGNQGIPYNLYAGGEMNIYMRRLHISPAVGLGFGGVIPTGDGVSTDTVTEKIYFSHVGGILNVPIAILFSRDMKLVFDVGFTGWVSIDQEKFSSLIGPMAGAGFCIKL